MGSSSRSRSGTAAAATSRGKNSGAATSRSRTSLPSLAASQPSRSAQQTDNKKRNRAGQLKSKANGTTAIAAPVIDPPNALSHLFIQLLMANKSLPVSSIQRQISLLQQQFKPNSPMRTMTLEQLRSTANQQLASIDLTIRETGFKASKVNTNQIANQSSASASTSAQALTSSLDEDDEKQSTPANNQSNFIPPVVESASDDELNSISGFDVRRWTIVDTCLDSTMTDTHQHLHARTADEMAFIRHIVCRCIANSRGIVKIKSAIQDCSTNAELRGALTQQFNDSAAQSLVDSLIQSRFLTRFSVDSVTLSPASVAELTPFILRFCSDILSRCALCKQICVFGFACPNWKCSAPTQQQQESSNASGAAAPSSAPCRVKVHKRCLEQMLQMSQSKDCICTQDNCATNWSAPFQAFQAECESNHKQIKEQRRASEAEEDQNQQPTRNNNSQRRKSTLQKSKQRKQDQDELQTDEESTPQQEPDSAANQRPKRQRRSHTQPNEDQSESERDATEPQSEGY